jgi:transposase-like protein
MNQNDYSKHLPNAEEIAKKLSQVKSPDDFFGKDGVFAKLFASTMEEMVEAELTDYLGYDKYEAKGRNSGNNRNGSYQRKLRTSTGDTSLNIPRDRNGQFKSKILKKYQVSSNEIEDKIIGLYAKGMTVRDIQDNLTQLYGIDISPTTISTITDKVLPLVEQWQARPLDEVYTLMFLDCIHVKLRVEGQIKNTAVYAVLAIDLQGKKQVLGHWLGNGGEGSSFWLNVIEDLQARGVKDILIASVDGLTGFSEAIHAVFPKTLIQKCIIHQIRNSLRYVAWKDRAEFVDDLKSIYKAKTKKQAEAALVKLADKWKAKYAIAVKSWENNWDELSTYFNFSKEIRRLMYTTNAIESYNRQIRKVIKTKSVFSTPNSVRKIFYLANQDITKKWTMPIKNWANILNQLAIKFEGRFKL